MVKWDSSNLNKIIEGLNKEQIISKYSLDFYKEVLSKGSKKSQPSYNRLIDDLTSLMENLRIYKNDLKYQNIRVLDLGCGYGEHAIFISQQNTVIGLDSNIKKIGIFKKIKNITNSHSSFPICGDGTNLPFKDESFDLVCCFQFISHVYDLTGSLSEIKRVLKSGGTIIIVDSTRKSLWSKFRYHIELPKEYAYIQKMKREMIVNYCNKNRIKITNKIIDSIVKNTKGWSKKEILMILDEYAKGNRDLSRLLNMYIPKFPFRKLENGNLIDRFFTPSEIIKILQKLGFWNVNQMGVPKGLKKRLIHYFRTALYDHVYWIMGRR